MGRKIPSKKHRGVKDPLKQQAVRLLSLRDKINAPPKDPDEQPVPRSLTELFAFKEQKTSKKKKNKVKPISQKDYSVSGAGDNPLSRLSKLPGESGREFSLRINSALRTLQSDGQKHEREEEDKKGEIMAFKRELREKKRHRREKERAKLAAAARERNGGGDGEEVENPQGQKLTRGQKLTLKKKAKILKSTQEKEVVSSEVKYDRVAFGEVVHAPPALPIPGPSSLRALKGDTSRAGGRDLLLRRLLVGGGATATGEEQEVKERARLEAVRAYRALKATKRTIKSTK